MNAKDAIRQNFAIAQMTRNMLLQDLEDTDLLVRPAKDANHIAWQLGHLIASENQMIGMVRADALPGLPEGFASKHDKENATSDAAGDFHSKADYLKMYDEQRAATLKLLDEIPEQDLDKPGPEKMRQIAPTLGAVFVLAGAHEVMHAGQFSGTRRHLGKPKVF